MKKKLPDNTNITTKESLEEQKLFFKMLLAPTMSLEEKIDELWDLPKENLVALLNLFQDDEDYEICHAIKEVLVSRNSDRT